MTWSVAMSYPLSCSIKAISRLSTLSKCLKGGLTADAWERKSNSDFSHLAHANKSVTLLATGFSTCSGGNLRAYFNDLFSRILSGNMLKSALHLPRFSASDKVAPEWRGGEMLSSKWVIKRNNLQREPQSLSVWTSTPVCVTVCHANVWVAERRRQMKSHCLFCKKPACCCSLDLGVLGTVSHWCIVKGSLLAPSCRVTVEVSSERGADWRTHWIHYSCFSLYKKRIERILVSHSYNCKGNNNEIFMVGKSKQRDIRGQVTVSSEQHIHGMRFSSQLKKPPKAPCKKAERREEGGKRKRMGRCTDISHPLPWSTECALALPTDTAAPGWSVQRCGRQTGS